MNPLILERRGVKLGQSLSARVPGMRLAFEMISLYRPGTGDATIRPLKDGEKIPEIWGVLHWLPISALDEHLDKWEAVDQGHYRRRIIEAEIDGSQIVQAITYEALHLDQHLRPSKEYLATILAGAEAFGLPKEYLNFLYNHPIETRTK